MNNDKKESSSQMSTTRFNNRNNTSSDRLNAIRNTPHTRNFSKDNLPNALDENEVKSRVDSNINDISHDNSVKNNNNERIDFNNPENNQPNQNNSSNYRDSRSNQSGQSGRSGIADSLRNRLNTSPSTSDLKNEAAKKGTETLKKSANPYAKAAGYAMGALQKRKEKKEQQEKEEEEEKSEENKESFDDEIEEERKWQQILKKLLPIIVMILPFLFIILVLYSVISPIVTAYSWFTSLFYHNSQDASSYTIYNEQDAANQKAEQDFNNAIRGSADGSVKGIVQEYQEKYGVTIDWYLLEALITYRYTADNSDLYSSSGSEDIDESELEERLKALESGESTEGGENTTEGSSSSVDYTAAKKKIEAFASLMVVKSGNGYVTDKEKGGVVYNNVLVSTTFKNYYKSMFADNTEEAHKQILDYIYDYAEGARELFEESVGTTSGGVVGDTSIIHLQTCKQPYTKQTINGVSVYNNPSWSEGTNYSDYLNAKDYLKGVVSREIGISNDYKEAMKAQMIAALTYLIHDSSSGFNLNSGEMYFPSGTCRQATCSPTDGCTAVVESTATNLHTFYVGQNRFSGGSSYGPINESDNAILEEVLNSVFGKIMVKKGVTSASFSGSSDAIATNYLDSCNPGTCFSQQGAINEAKSGMTYEQILQKYYSSYEYDIIDITEGLYFTSTGTYSGTINLNEAYHYHQGDSEWADLILCGSGNIKKNGCNITSAAIAISLLTNQRITPATLQSRQSSISACSPSSRPQMIMNFGKLYGLSATSISKSNTSALNDMLSKLATGNYVAIARLTADSGRSFYRSGGGHYMAIVGVKTENNTNMVLVWDPASKDASRDNRWVDMNALVEILQNEYSFILIGR